MTRLLAAGACTAMAALAHYTWVAPIVAPLAVGKTATVQISHGHKFPRSEEAINARQVDLFVVTPSGQRVKLEASAGATAVSAPFAVREAGLHRIAFVQDRGVTSRTPAGVKPGGRDKNPDATQSSRTFRTAVSYAIAGKIAAPAAQPLGLEIELVAALANGVWQVQLLKQGQPVADAAIEVFLAGAAKTESAGKTGADGRVRFTPPAGARGPAMFSVELKDPPPPGAAYDRVNYETSLFVTW